MKYKNLGGNSSVIAYDIYSDAISVTFKGGHRYVYTYSSAGSHHVERMKQLANQGYGLCSYIQRNVKFNYLH